MVCEDRVWTATTCEEVCAALGPAYISDGCDEQCLCVLADPEGCEPGETLCVDEDTLEECSPTQQWEPSSCADLCAEFGLEPLGCEPAASEFDAAQCWCTTEGTPCNDTLPVCADDSTIAWCIEGTWVFEDCAATCGGPATCDPWVSPVECAC